MSDENELILRGVVTIRISVEKDGKTKSREESIDCNNFSLAVVGTYIQRNSYELLRQIVEEVQASKGQK